MCGRGGVNESGEDWHGAGYMDCMGWRRQQWFRSGEQGSRGSPLISGKGSPSGGLPPHLWHTTMAAFLGSALHEAGRRVGVGR